MKRVAFGQHWAFNVLNDPKRLAFVLARYRFAAKMIPPGSSVLELGCSEGFGIPLLMETAGRYSGVDMDPEAIATARENWKGGNLEFIEADFLGNGYGAFDAVVSFDVVEHISPATERLFFRTVFANLHGEGIGIVGTPNVNASPYALEASRRAHVNLFSAERLKAAMHRFFRNTFIFCLNDEVVHTGFAPMAHYVICLGCFRREEELP